MKTLILLISLILITSCNRNENAEFQSTEIDFTNIRKGRLPGNGAENIVESNLIINSETDWQNLMSQMNSVNSYETSTFTETTIDFSNYSVIAIFREVKPNDSEVEINSIIENEDNITISITETNFQLPAISQPYHIVKIPKTNKEIVLE